MIPERELVKSLLKQMISIISNAYEESVHVEYVEKINKNIESYKNVIGVCSSELNSLYPASGGGGNINDSIHSQFDFIQSIHGPPTHLNLPKQQQQQQQHSSAFSYIFSPLFVTSVKKRDELASRNQLETLLHTLEHSQNTFDAKLTKMVNSVVMGYCEMRQDYTNKVNSTMVYASERLKDIEYQKTVVSNVIAMRREHNARITFNSVTIDDNMSIHDKEACIRNSQVVGLPTSKISRYINREWNILDKSSSAGEQQYNPDDISRCYNYIMKNLKCSICSQFEHNQYYCSNKHCSFICHNGGLKYHCPECKVISKNNMSRCTLRHCTVCMKHGHENHECYKNWDNKKKKKKKNGNKKSPQRSNNNIYNEKRYKDFLTSLQ
jgi:hypothetical protein